MLCRVEMPANEEIFGRFYRYRMLKAKNGGRASVVVMPLFAVIVAVLIYSASANILFAALPALVALVYLVHQLYLRPKQIFNKKGGAAMFTEVTILTESGYQHIVKSEEGGHPDTSGGQYGALNQAVETSQDFFLFTSPAVAIMLDKDYFTKGSPEELRATLKKALGNKFKGKK